MLVPTHNYQKHIITELQSLTHACTNVPRRTPSGTSSLVYSAQRRTSPTTCENSPNDRSHIPKQRKKGKKRIPLLVYMVLVCSHSDPSEARSPSGKSRGYPREPSSQQVLQLSRVGPIWGARNDAVKSRS